MKERICEAATRKAWLTMVQRCCQGGQCGYSGEHCHGDE